MRKASHALIASNLAQLPTWEARLQDVTTPGFARLAKRECAEVRARITAGDCTVTTQSLIRFINRTAAECRRGEIRLMCGRCEVPNLWTLGHDEGRVVAHRFHGR